jgi:hypothetical protein
MADIYRTKVTQTAARLDLAAVAPALRYIQLIAAAKAQVGGWHVPVTGRRTASKQHGGGRVRRRCERDARGIGRGSGAPRTLDAQPDVVLAGGNLRGRGQRQSDAAPPGSIVTWEVATVVPDPSTSMALASPPPIHPRRVPPRRRPRLKPMPFRCIGMRCRSGVVAE